MQQNYILKHCIRFFFVIGLAGLMNLMLLMAPKPLYSQTSSFSLSLDGDATAGDQAMTSLDLSPDQTASIQIFGTDIQNASRITLRFEYDAAQVVYKEFDANDVLPSVEASVEPDSGTGSQRAGIQITLSSSGGPVTVNRGLIGTIRFGTTDAFSETEIRLERAELVREGQTESAMLALSAALQVAAPPSPDFDGNGVVQVPDFLLFVDAYGYRAGQAQYDGKYDLDGDGEIGIPDFLIFVDSFGKTVNRPPVFTTSDPVTRVVAENTLSNTPFGEPITATDADGDNLTYSLQGADADSFAIDARTGQIKTRVGYDFERRHRYSVIVRASDGAGSRDRVVVGIAITDIDESTASVPPTPTQPTPTPTPTPTQPTPTPTPTQPTPTQPTPTQPTPTPSGPTTGPDLVIESFTISKTNPLKPRETFTLTVKVCNYGNSTSDPTSVVLYSSYYYYHDDFVGSTSVPDLKKGECVSPTAGGTAPNFPGNNYFWDACVRAVKDETNTDNNCFDPPLSITVRR